MIVDSFEIDGEEVDIHILDDDVKNCFSVVARNKNNESFNGFEFRIKRIGNLAVDTFAQCAPAFAIVSFMRRQIEENHWAVYEGGRVEMEILQSAINTNPRAEGRRAFLNKQHYCNNPYTELNVFVHDEWDQGWAEEAQKNPDAFDFVSDSFKE